jgi:AraC family transcriptional regulator, regulatory protein of adaptative response / methylphosphotriester-DNA alkyltransferase methyltransferase
MDVSDELYAVMIKRASTFDGKLYIGITSTGIVCFPSCRSRLPKRENVRVYGSLDDAIQAGFRPCKRCKPDNPQNHSPDAEIAKCVLALIAHRYHEPLTLAVMAEALNVSPYHLQRIVKRHTNLSPARHLLATRMERAKELLCSEDLPIQEVAKGVGFRSVSHFSGTFQKEVGITPSAFRLQVVDG